MQPRDARRIAEALGPYQRLLVLTHNNPDPDALAAAAGIKELVDSLDGPPTTIGYAGFLTRAENHEMVKRLHLQVQNVREIDLRLYRAVILVDTQPSAGNNALGDNHTPVAVVDHHPARSRTKKCPLAFLDKEVGATSTLVYEMLKAADVKMSSRLATALYLGIKTDTQDLGREATLRDLAAYKELFALTDHRTLAQITHPRLSSDYFRVVHRALEAAVICGDCLYAAVGDVPSPEFVSEIADYLVALKGMRWAIVTGRFGENLFFSIRTLTARKDAGRLLQKAIGKFGMAGGHQKIAGGLLPLADLEQNQREAAEATVISKLFEAVGANTSAARPLLSTSKADW